MQKHKTTINQLVNRFHQIGTAIALTKMNV